MEEKKDPRRETRRPSLRKLFHDLHFTAIRADDCSSEFKTGVASRSGDRKSESTGVTSVHRPMFPSRLRNEPQYSREVAQQLIIGRRHRRRL